MGLAGHEWRRYPVAQTVPVAEPETPLHRGDVIPLWTATRTWFAISLQTFGGPAGQIAVMQHHLVDRHRWIGQRRFLHALNYCMLLPGPEAQQLGDLHRLAAQRRPRRPDRRHAVRAARDGGAARPLAVYVGFGDTALVAALFAGLAPAVIAIVVQAVFRVGRRALTHPALVVLAAAAFVALTFFAVPFPVVVLGAGAGRLAAQPPDPRALRRRRTSGGERSGRR